MPPKLSYGLNLPNKKPALGAQNPGQKRKKAIFDDSDSDNEDANKNSKDGAVEISTIDGLEEPPSTKPQPSKNTANPPPPKRKIPFGQNAPSKPGAKPLSKNSIFADDDDDDDNNKEQNGGGTEILGQSDAPYGLNPSKSQSQSQNAYTNLSALHSSKKHAQDAQELDPSIYSYDSVYDSLHAKPSKGKDPANSDSNSGVPRYMTSLLRSAEIRKRDQLRAKDRMIAKEREEEGDEFADKEKFVTSAYKAQQEEMRKVEAEEAERERLEEERRKQNAGSGMVNFYRDMLSRGEQQHEAAVKAAEETARKVQAGEKVEEVEEEKKNEKTETEKAAELNARGAHIAVNDEGHVVDKRQLLSAGLNVAPKPKPQPSAAKPTAGAAGARGPAGPRSGAGQAGGRAGQRARQTEMIAAQLEAQAKQEEEAEAARQREVEERSRSRKTEGDVSSARERYLARKKEREEAAAKGK